MKGLFILSIVTHHAEQPVKINAFFVGLRSVPQGTVDLTGRGGTPFTALAALALQLGMAAQSHPMQVVELWSAVQNIYYIVHLQAIQ